MKRKLSALFLCVFLAPMAHAGKTVLPDACGDDKVKFDVKTEKNQPAPAAPETGKALLVFAETFDQNMGLCIGCNVTTRTGLDGTWIGANQGNSYFALDITPGEHHLCVGWQSVFGKLKKEVGLTSFTAEAGKVYYFQAKVKITQYGGGNHSSRDYSLDLVPMTQDEGQYRIKAWKLATSTPSK